MGIRKFLRRWQISIIFVATFTLYMWGENRGVTYTALVTDGSYEILREEGLSLEECRKLTNVWFLDYKAECIYE